MSNYETWTCDHCRQPFQRAADGPVRELRCAVCQKLGDRSLVWYQIAVQEEIPDRAERFAAAKGRSWMIADVLYHAKAGHRLPPGILQLAQERSRL
jgi:hypothetical protein